MRSEVRFGEHVAFMRPVRARCAVREERAARLRAVSEVPDDCPGLRAIDDDPAENAGGVHGAHAFCGRDRQENAPARRAHSGAAAAARREACRNRVVRPALPRALLQDRTPRPARRVVCGDGLRSLRLGHAEEFSTRGTHRASKTAYLTQASPRSVTGGRRRTSRVRTTGSDPGPTPLRPRSDAGPTPLRPGSDPTDRQTPPLIRLKMPFAEKARPPGSPVRRCTLNHASRQ